MPKRKYTDLDYLSSQIKKLKKKLKKARKHEESSSSSDSDTKTTIQDNDLIQEVFQTELETPDVDQTNAVTTFIEQPSEQQDTSSVSPAPESSLDQEILDILGEDPCDKDQMGREIHKELASRLEYITTTGLTKETRKELQQKYRLPSNGILLGAPIMNPEIKAALPETLSNRDKAIETKQKLLGTAISCLAEATSQMLESKNKDPDLLKKLMDTNKILCDIQHSDSVTRRMFSTSVLRKDVKTQIYNLKIDKFLFGENLPDALKTAKAVSKSGAEIKYSANSKKPQPSTSKTNNLNAKAPAVGPSRKPPVTTQKTRQPTSRPNQPARPFKTSSQQQKPNNRRPQ